MSVTYTNEIKTNLLDPLKGLIFAEFPIVELVCEPGFDAANMTHGEYIRYWLLDSTEVAKFAIGETREYEVEIVYYFDVRRRQVKKAFDDVYSDRLEHLKRLLDNNSSYNDGTYRWHNIEIDVSPFQTVEQLEDIEEEQTMAVRLLCLITRSNIRG